ncbi:hypothetical protein [Yoonia sp.]|uniref:hypothetical protein n=1 Tax=Yoonia sp. TaxID=2212373 RepID=UPI0025F890C4|nr:hypothetical protein [Yoonia sp.]
MLNTPLPHITRWSDLNGVALTPAENIVIDAAKAGKRANIGDTTPTTKTEAVLIRAPLLRYLILGGCDECRTQAAGVEVQGAWIEHTLDLSFATAAGPISLYDCHIAARPEMMHLKLHGLYLNRSTLPSGLNAQGVQVGGDVFLRGLKAKGAVSLSGAAITGQLACEGATLENADGPALNLQRAQVGGGVFLSGLTAKGAVSLSGAAITGQLDCEGATLENADGPALNLQRASVKGGFLWRNVKAVTGRVNLSSAHFADLADDAASWDKCNDLTMVGLTYDVLHGSTDVLERLDWLKKGAKNDGGFHPQPYEQLAKVLRESGHRAEAREILIAKEREQRKTVRARRCHKRHWLKSILSPRNIGSTIVDIVFRETVGYGYKPHRSIFLLVFLISLGAYVAAKAWDAGDFAPNSDVILNSAGWQALADDRTAYPNPAATWSDPLGPGQDYETFQPVAYAVDIVIPIIALGQETAWSPSTNRGWWGRQLWWLEWCLTALGWIVTAIGAAAVTGVIRRD